METTIITMKIGLGSRNLPYLLANAWRVERTIRRERRPGRFEESKRGQLVLGQ